MTRQISLTDELTALLRAHRAPPSYALFEQVPDRVGGGNRTADAISMGLWPSRGLTVEGYEIKAYRGDWLRELKHPQKAEPLARWCDFWWIVAPATIVTVDEIPDAWGLLVPHGKGLRTLKPALRQEADPLTRPFIAGLLRRAARPGEQALAQARADGFAAGVAARKADEERHRGVHLRELEQLAAYVKDFEARTGIEVNTWRPVEEFAETFQLARAATNARHEADRLHRMFAATAQSLERALNGDVVGA